MEAWASEGGVDVVEVEGSLILGVEDIGAVTKSSSVFHRTYELCKIDT